MMEKIFQKNFWPIVYKKTRSLGEHLIAEFWGVKIEEDMAKIEKILIEAAKKTGSTPLEVVSHKFSPKGFSAMILLAESHIALHYWPENEYLAVDIFTCGKDSDPQKGLEYLKEQFQPKKMEVQRINRGKVLS